MSLSTSTLINQIWKPTQSLSLVRNIMLAITGSLLVALAAQITVPMWPVPMTLQTLAVLAVGAAYGSRLGAVTLVLYAIEGAVGLPFFAGGQAGLINPQGLILSSGGFIIGFILAAWLVGKLLEQGWSSSIVKTILAALIGTAVIYIPGLIWLAVWAAKTQSMGAGDAVQAAISWGFTPFWLGDVVKAIIAALAVGGASLGLAKK